MPRLRRSDPAVPGLTRRRAGKGFTYLDASGERLTDVAALERIKALAIPPAWRDVWICPWPNGHIQAIGTDAAGRKQYRYHEEWRKRRDREKFEKMLEFAAVLPQLRSTVIEHLALPGLPEAKALACAVRLLDLGFFRVGSEDYAEENETYGLATIRKEHVKLQDEQIVFDYIAKSGKRRIQVITDEQVREVVAQLKRRRGGERELLAWRRDDGEWRDVRSDDVNDYIKEHAGDFSAKDFRTWNGTVLAAVGIAMKAEMATTKTGRKRAISQTVKEVAFFLGNTPAVARASYIDPRVFDRFSSGWTIAARVRELGGPEAFIDPEGRVALEDAVRDLIRDERDESPALAHVDVAA
jgi:DNA topoisomerase IB